MLSPRSKTVAGIVQRGCVHSARAHVPAQHRAQRGPWSSVALHRSPLPIGSTLHGEAVRAMDTVAEFQQRRAKTWRHVRFSIFVMLASFLVLFFHCEGVQPEPTPRFWICFIASALVVATIAHISFAWKRSYRCPICEVPVMNSAMHGGNVPFNPNVCPNCGARLK